MNPVDYKPYALFILESTKTIRTYLDMDPTLETRLIYDAILRNLHVLADATKFLDPRLKEQAGHVRWRKIVGFRNILVHDYLGDIDIVIVKHIIENELDLLEQAINEFYEF